MDLHHLNSEDFGVFYSENELFVETFVGTSVWHLRSTLRLKPDLEEDWTLGDRLQLCKYLSADANIAGTL